MKKRRKKRAILLLVIVVVIIGIIMILLKRQGDGSMSEVNSSIETNEIVRGSNDSGAYYLDVNKTGIFYLDNGRMKYLDYGMKKSYYICDKANCLHQNKNCGSYATNFSGFGAYAGHLYAMRKDYQTNSYDFIQMEMNGTSRKVLATIDASDFGKNKQDGGTLDLEYEDIYYAYLSQFPVNIPVWLWWIGYVGIYFVAAIAICLLISLITRMTKRKLPAIFISLILCGIAIFLVIARMNY